MMQKRSAEERETGGGGRERTVEGEDVSERV